jgi:hypothetical protein
MASVNRFVCALAALILIAPAIPRPADAQIAAPVPAVTMIARDATIALKVPHYDRAVEAVTQAAAADGAELMDSKTYVDDKGRKHGWMRLTVRSGKFDALHAGLRSAGVLYSDSIAGEDQEPDYEAFGRRADQLSLHQQRLEGVLNGKRRLRGSDILYIQDRLLRAGTDQQDMLQQQVDMKRRAATGLIMVELFEPYTLPAPAHQITPLAPHFQSSFSLAHAAINQMAARTTTALAYAVTFSPLWGPVAIIAIAILVWIWRKRRAIAAAVVHAARSLVNAVRRPVSTPDQ